jgi:hypothetical protein
LTALAGPYFEELTALQQPDDPEHERSAEQRHEDQAQAAELVGEEDQHAGRSATAMPRSVHRIVSTTHADARGPVAFFRAR